MNNSLELVSTIELDTTKVRICTEKKEKIVLPSFGEVEGILYIPTSSFLTINSLSTVKDGYIIISSPDGIFKYYNQELPEDDIFKKAMSIFDRPGINIEYFIEDLEPINLDSYLLIGLVNLYSDLTITPLECSTILNMFSKPGVLPLYLSSLTNKPVIDINSLGLTLLDPKI